MASNLKIDQDLLTKAQRIGRFSTKKETVNKALEEFIQYRKQLEILEEKGKVEFFDDYDYKALRRKR